MLREWASRRSPRSTSRRSPPNRIDLVFPEVHASFTPRGARRLDRRLAGEPVLAPDLRLALPLLLLFGLRDDWRDGAGLPALVERDEHEIGARRVHFPLR